MSSKNVLGILVFIGSIVILSAAHATAWDYHVAAGTAGVKEPHPEGNETLKAVQKVKPEKPITKVKPPLVPAPEPQRMLPFAPTLGCMVPFRRPSGWEIEGQAIFARLKGKVRYLSSSYYYAGQLERIDMNTDLGLPDHWVIPSFSVAYTIRPNWAFRYSIMPMSVEGSKMVHRSFTFGTIIFSYGDTARLKWDRLYHRVGLMYDPIRTPESRVTFFAEYVRIDDRLKLIQERCCETTVSMEANMAMAGLEIERCLLALGSRGSAVSISCQAGVSFVDDAFGTDIATGLRYNIPLLNGRSGYLEGGYRYVSHEKKYSDLKSVETFAEGGFVQIGFVF